MKNKTITSILMISILLLSLNFISARTVTNLGNKIIVSDYSSAIGNYQVIIRPYTQWDVILNNNFQIGFGQSEAYVNEDVDITATVTKLGTPCSIYSWELFLVKDGGTKTSLGHYEDEFDIISGCNLEATVIWKTSYAGTYSLEHKWKWTSSSSTSTETSYDAELGHSEVTVIDEPVECKYRPYEFYDDITGGSLYISRNTCPNDYDNKYKTYCETGYLITGSTATTANIKTTCSRDNSCVPFWNCTDWGTCISSQQIRICTDSNNCNNNAGKPNQVRICDGTIGGTIGNQLGIDSSEISSKTIEDLLSSVCVTQNDCEINSSCNSLQSLKEGGQMTDIQAQTIANSFADKIATMSKWGTGITATVACGFLLGATGPGVIPICGGVGIASYFGLDKWFSDLSEKSLSKTGLCIKTSSSFWCKYTSWASFFPITKNKCTDGLIIIFGGVLLTILLLKR